MFTPVLTPQGTHLAQEGYTSPYGKADFLPYSCNNCGEIHHYQKGRSIKNKRCSCTPKLRKNKVTLTINDLTRTIPEWRERYPLLDNRSYNRHSDRNRGLNLFTDEEVLCGKGKRLDEFDVDVPLIASWLDVIDHSLAKARIKNKSLYEAVAAAEKHALYEAINLAMQHESFVAPRKPDRLTESGEAYQTSLGSLHELKSALGVGWEGVADYLREEENLNDTELKNLGLL